MMIDAATGVTHIKAGALKALGAATDKRIPAAEDVPTIAEAGVPGFEAWAWNGMRFDRHAVRHRRQAECGLPEGSRQSRITERFSEISVDPAPSTPEEFGAFIKSETDKWRVVTTEAGISLK